MILKDKLSESPAFAYVCNSLEMMSSVGHRRLLEQPWLATKEALQQEWDRVAAMVAAFGQPEYKRQVVEFRHQLMELQDLHGTFHNLEHGVPLQEIELFQIKQFAFHTMAARQAAEAMGLQAVLCLPEVAPVFRLLDPDGTGVPSFYIYDSYHPDLPAVRNSLRAKQNAMAKLEALSEEEMDAPRRAEMNGLHADISALLLQQDQIQEQVMQNLTAQLLPHHGLLCTALQAMAYADLLQAKATQAIDWQLCPPATHPTHTSYTCIVNLRLLHHNQQQHLRYQPVDVSLTSGVCLITGANMAGKTVLLKTIGCAQLMAQFGMFAPAESCHIVPVEDVLFCIGDEQDEMQGLSSFASEIIKISDAVTRADRQKLLILMDEPARTTNPTEGKALVQAIGRLLLSGPSLTLMATHYGQLGLPCRRLRVRGFVENLSTLPLTPQNINHFMDYSLLPDTDDHVPMEALRIATILGCNPRMIAAAREALTTESPTPPPQQG